MKLSAAWVHRHDFEYVDLHCPNLHRQALKSQAVTFDVFYHNLNVFFRYSTNHPNREYYHLVDLLTLL
jgi:hypothetical protein